MRQVLVGLGLAPEQPSGPREQRDRAADDDLLECEQHGEQFGEQAGLDNLGKVLGGG